ncbi:MAG: hypothetical protein DRN12_02290 [Thermoplasmata archaeon]|nr:MAG: hypothetical protein DRN12_02290 [Thermoplasmata archaeon]
MGKRIDKSELYAKLSPEELHTHVRKNISIPKYMDAFLYEHNISLSKLVQNAIKKRMLEEQKTEVEKAIELDYRRRIAEKRIAEEKRKDPKFEQKLLQAKQLLRQYFNALDQGLPVENYKQQMLKGFPELYIDISRFEEWKKNNEGMYKILKEEIHNPIERLIRIKKEYFRRKNK